ncbi:MAG: peptide chain release factor N(5)-glutamine methyltransferase [Alphaproteobacteria bacterium]
MKTNQAFTILCQASDSHTARIITENQKKFNLFSVLIMAKKLKQGMPVAKIIHKKWFYGLPFYTNTHTLDPRPDTETLIESVINDYKNTTESKSILDLGTGTGCIICSIIKNIPLFSGVAMDKSYQALRVANKNIKSLELHNKVKIKHGNFCKPIHIKQKFDVIVSNPPYIKYGDSNVDIGAMHDPKIALYAKNDGYFAYERIAKHAKNLIKPNGKIYLEIGINMGDSIRKIFSESGWTFERTERDLSGIERVLVFKD